MAGKTIGVAVPDSDFLELIISEITVLIKWGREKLTGSGTGKVFVPIQKGQYLKLVFIFLHWC